MGRMERRSARRLGWAATTGVVLIAAMAATLLGNGPDDRPLPGREAPSAIAIAPADEPGERLRVQGRVYAPDGETPVAGVVLYVYQTGADGRYAPPGERVPRLRGWVRTDEQGRYTVRSVRPGSYPGRDEPAHVHTLLWGAGYEPQWAPDLLFDDDPLLGPEERRESQARGRFGHVCAPETTPAGELLCTRHYRLKPQGDRIPSELDHAFQARSEG